jgi:hypothetical protein
MVCECFHRGGALQIAWRALQFGGAAPWAVTLLLCASLRQDLLQLRALGSVVHEVISSIRAHQPVTGLAKSFLPRILVRIRPFTFF